MAIQSRQATLPIFLLTRPAAQSDRFADQLRGRFGAEIRVVVSPLLVPRFLSPVLPDRKFQGVIFTSETAVAAFRQLSADRHGIAWCVGDRTAEAARSAGFVTRSAGGDADALVAAVQAAPATGPMLHPRGREATGNVAERLNSAGIETLDAVVYAQEPVPMIDTAKHLFSGDIPVMVPVFSPRSGEILARESAVAERSVPLWVAALSNAAAAATRPIRPERIATAERPDALALLAAIAELIVTTGQP